MFFDGFEVVITRVYENDSEEVLVFNMALIQISGLSGGKNQQYYFLTLKTKNTDQIHVFNVDEINGWDSDSLIEIRNEIKFRQIQARELTKNSAV